MEEKKKFVVDRLAIVSLFLMLVSCFLIARMLLDDRSNIQLLLMSMVFAGAIGGIVNYFYSNMNEDITSKNLVPCVVVGIGASLLLPFLFSLTSSTLLSDELNDVRYLTIVSWSLLAGISGEPLISMMTSRFIKSIGDDRDLKAVASLNITPTTLPEGTVGVEYSQVLQVKGGKRPLYWEVKPSLPVGLNLINGEITGIPRAAFDTRLTFTVKDSLTPDPRSGASDIWLKINPENAQNLRTTSTSL